MLGNWHYAFGSQVRVPIFQVSKASGGNFSEIMPNLVQRGSLYKEHTNGYTLLCVYTDTEILPQNSKVKNLLTDLQRNDTNFRAKYSKVSVMYKNRIKSNTLDEISILNGIVTCLVNSCVNIWSDRHTYTQLNIDKLCMFFSLLTGYPLFMNVKVL